jgi:hypothetical protein
MSPDLILLLVSVGSVVFTTVAQKRGWLPTPKPDAPAPVPTPVQPANGEADKPALDFLQWLLSVKAGAIKLDDLDREVLKQIAAAMPEGGSPSNPIIEDVVKRILAALASKNAVAGA